MALGPKLRFEVFKRDGFTCQYCGRKTPIVVLEVDHIIPRAEGGGDEMENLVTSCFECNRGKGAGLLDEKAPVVNMHEQSILLLERELQLKEYNHVRATIRQREEDDVGELLTYWDDLCGKRARCFPETGSLLLFLKVIPREDIKDAMQAAFARKGPAGIAYLYGILHKKRRDALGLTEE